MNKLTKVGFSALCGSLAAISSANAGELTVTGGVDMSWVSLENQATGNPIGMGSNLTFKGSGELNNGWTFDLGVAHANANAFSAAYVNITMGGLGTLKINQGDSSNGISAIDDKMPTAWEEVWGAGLSTGIKTVVGAGSSMNIMYATPKVLGTTITATYAPAAGTTDTGDKGVGGTNASFGDAMDATININASLGTEILSGLNLFVGASNTDYTKNNATYQNELYEATAGVTFDIGPFSIGAQRSGHITGIEVATSAATHYKSNMYGVAFNVNDDLSLSYGRHESYKHLSVGDSATAAQGDHGERTITATSWQVAYSMGGASIRLADTKGDNLYYISTRDEGATTLSVALAF